MKNEREALRFMPTETPTRTRLLPPAANSLRFMPGETPTKTLTQPSLKIEQKVDPVVVPRAPFPVVQPPVEELYEAKRSLDSWMALHLKEKSEELNEEEIARGGLRRYTGEGGIGGNFLVKYWRVRKLIRPLIARSKFTREEFDEKISGMPIGYDFVTVDKNRDLFEFELASEVVAKGSSASLGRRSLLEWIELFSKAEKLFIESEDFAGLDDISQFLPRNPIQALMPKYGRCFTKHGALEQIRKMKRERNI